MMKFCKIGKWHRSHGKLVHYQDQITRPPFWDMWHMRRQSTSNDSLTSISHQCVVLSPRAYFSRIFRVVQRPAQKVGNRQVRKKLSERCTKSGHNFHVNVGWQISNYHFTGYIGFHFYEKCIKRREMYHSVCEQKPSHPGNCKFIFW